MDSIMAYLLEYRYWALLVMALMEGPIVAFIAGAFVARGYFDPLAAFAVLAFNDLVLDTVFYWIGSMVHIPLMAKLIAKMRTQTGLADRTFTAIEKGWHDHPARLMWIGKLAYGLSAWFIISAGIAGVPFRKFYLYTLPVSIFQFCFLMEVGYLLGLSVWNSANWIFMATQGVIALAVVFYGFRALARYIRRRYTQT